MQIETWCCIIETTRNFYDPLKNINAKRPAVPAASIRGVYPALEIAEIGTLELSRGPHFMWHLLHKDCGKKQFRVVTGSPPPVTPVLYRRDCRNTHFRVVTGLAPEIAGKGTS